MQLIILLLNLVALQSMSQSVPQGMTYQGLARDASGSVIASQPISIKVGVYAPAVSGTLEWEETHSVTTNQLGLFYFIIGQGVSTAAGSVFSFSSINWGANAHFIKIAMDPAAGSSYLDLDTIQFWSVPYAMYSGMSDSLTQPMRLSQLSDVDTLGVFTGAVLKWNGTLWAPAADHDSDTASYAFNAGHATTSDTATFAMNVLSTIDTIPFAYSSDSAFYAANSGTASLSLNSNYCDTATYAFNTGSAYTYWNLTGNSGTTPTSDFVGTTDAQDLVLKTNSIERMRITSAGKVGIGTSLPTAALHVIGDDGIVAEGTFGLGAVPPSGAGTRMVWYPKKAAFRTGGVNGTQWNDVNIGNYSFASGYNTLASGAYSTAFGSGSIASGQYSIAACENSQASGISSVAMGLAAIASGPYSTALGRAPQATDSFSVAIGYHCLSTAKYSAAFGDYSVADGDHSVTFGYRSNSNGKSGCFVFADASSTASTLNSANNQFMVRASGGVVLYSNIGMTTGVSLAAGGGSWSSVSDRNKKEHFKKIDSEDVLKKLNNIDITTWNYKTQSEEIRHIGPMAQDFYAAFGFGESDTTIATIDVDGLSLLAIQALSRKTEDLKNKTAEIEKLKAQIYKMEVDKKILEKRIEGMEHKLNIVPVSYSGR